MTISGESLAAWPGASQTRRGDSAIVLLGLAGLIALLLGGGAFYRSHQPSQISASGPDPIYLPDRSQGGRPMFKSTPVVLTTAAVLLGASLLAGAHRLRRSKSRSTR